MCVCIYIIHACMHAYMHTYIKGDEHIHGDRCGGFVSSLNCNNKLKQIS